MGHIASLVYYKTIRKFPFAVSWISMKVETFASFLVSGHSSSLQMAPVGRLIMELQRRGEREAMMNWLHFLQEVVKTFKRLAKESSMIAVMKTTATLITGLQLGPVRVPLANVEDQSKLAKELESLKLVTKVQEAEKELTDLM